MDSVSSGIEKTLSMLAVPAGRIADAAVVLGDLMSREVCKRNTRQNQVLTIV